MSADNNNVEKIVAFILCEWAKSNSSLVFIEEVINKLKRELILYADSSIKKAKENCDIADKRANEIVKESRDAFDAAIAEKEELFRIFNTSELGLNDGPINNIPKVPLNFKHFTIIIFLILSFFSYGQEDSIFVNKSPFESLKEKYYFTDSNAHYFKVEPKEYLATAIFQVRNKRRPVVKKIIILITGLRYEVFLIPKNKRKPLKKKPSNWTLVYYRL